MSSIAIRPMLPADIPAVAALVAAVPLWQRYLLTEAAVAAEFARAFERGDLLLVAESDPPPGPTGFAWCVLGAAFGRSGYLRLIGVREGCGGRGIGAGLLAAVEDAVREASRDLFLLVSDFNGGAQRFYHSHGYEPVGAIPGYVLPEVTELIYRKRLDPSRTPRAR